METQIKTYLEKACTQAAVRLSMEKLSGHMESIMIETRDLDKIRNQLGNLFESGGVYSIILIFQEDSNKPLRMDELKTIRGHIEGHQGNTIEQFSIISENGNDFRLCILYWEKNKVKNDNTISVAKEYFLRYNIDNYNISEVYALYPKKGEYGWPECWPSNVESGVYIVYDQEMIPLYIGEASILGRRLSCYFKYSENSDCQAKQEWSRKPCFVQTITLCNDFERFSLEAYLIQQIQPKDNSRLYKLLNNRL